MKPDNDVYRMKYFDLINPESEFVPVEVCHIAGLMGHDRDYHIVESVYRDVVRLFDGSLPGYRACNTMYHDLEHTTDTLLAMARLMHGAFVNGERFDGRSVRLGLISALLHDAGYIQTADDTEGTGAKYTSTHIDRGIVFIERYFRDRGFSPEDAAFCRNCLLCTGMGTDISGMAFASEEESVTGRMLGAADLLGQMADRKYPEKLLCLYREFREGNVPGYDSEKDLLRKTLDFKRLTDARLAGELGGVNAYMRLHFSWRWDLDADPYRQSIERNIAYIRFVMENGNGDYRDYLRRGGVVRWMRELGE